MPHDLDTDTELTAGPDGTFTLDITPRWNAMFDAPNGGHSAVILTKAMARVLPHPDPLVVSTTFLRRAATGPSSVVTEVVREGRRLSTGQASLITEGRESVRQTATFGDLRAAEGPTALTLPMVELPPPGECRIPQAPVPVSIAERFEFAVPPRREERTAEAVFWMRFADGSDADLISLVQLVDGAIPPVALIGHPSSTTVEMTTHLRAHPAPGWLACRARTRVLVNGLHEEDFDVWDSTGQLVAQSRQLALLL